MAEEEIKFASNRGYSVAHSKAPEENVLVLSEENDGEEDDNAFADMNSVLTLTPANKVEEPVVTQTNLREIAEHLVESEINERAPDHIQKLIEEIAPFRIANIFANYGQSHVEQVMNAYAPDQLDRIIAEIAPEKINELIASTLEQKIAERLNELLPKGLEVQVAELVKEELQGAFGYAITRKIRKLIQGELQASLAT